MPQHTLIIPLHPCPTERAAAAPAWPVRLVLTSPTELPLANNGDTPTLAQTPAILIGASEAAALLGITRDALYMRVSRGQLPGVVKTGRRTQFHRERLFSVLERRSTK